MPLALSLKNTALKKANATNTTVKRIPVMNNVILIPIGVYNKRGIPTPNTNASTKATDRPVNKLIQIFFNSFEAIIS